MVYLPHWPIPSSLGNRKIDYETVFERMSLVLEKLGNPHQKLPPVIHVAGTNGKGSITALLTKIYLEAGYKTHNYTSPHLHHCNERIILNGEKISDGFLYEIMEEVRIAAEEIPLTFMEGFTIGAFLAFSKTPADIAIIECGMGGRIDATNVIEKKLATIISPISFDHMEYLGDSIQRIALEKAMIMRKETPLIISSQSLEAKKIIKLLASDQNIKSYFYDEDFSIAFDEENGEFDLNFEEKTLKNLPKPALIGQHQYINFATAIAACLAINSQFKVKEEDIKKAIKTVFWPNRLEKIQNNLNKLLKNPKSEIYIDGAHNEGGAFALAKFIKESKIETFVIVGFSLGKCKIKFLEKFKEVAKEIIAVRVNGEPYPEDPQIIKEIGLKANIDINAQDDLLDAINYISKKNNQKTFRIIICGSLHLARDVVKFGK